MVTNEPMTDEQLDDIDEMLHDGDELPHDVAVRLANEVDRLRAREQALQLQLDAMSSLLLDVQRDCVAARQVANVMRPIVETVAEHIGGYVSERFRQCAFCGNGAIESRVIAHANGCEVEQARAFVAAHPATDTAAAESEGE